LDTSITTFQTRTSQIKTLDWIRICCSSVCRSFAREAAVETLIRPCRCRTWCDLTPFHSGVELNHSTARHTATIIGTVTDVNGGVIPNATVVLREVQNNHPTILATRNGLFQFNDVAPGSTFQLSIRAKDFSDWTSPLITVHPGQFKIVTGIQLQIATARTIVDVHYDPVEVATEQFKLKKSSAYSESFRIFTFL
jgi:hypothetical protein